MKQTNSRQLLKSKYKTRSITQNQSKQHNLAQKQMSRQRESMKGSTKRTVRTKPKQIKTKDKDRQNDKDRPASTLSHKGKIVREQKLRTIMNSTMDLLKTSIEVDSGVLATTQYKQIQKDRQQKNKDLIYLAQNIHSLVQNIVRKQCHKQIKKSESFITDTDKQKNLNRNSLLKYFETKFASDAHDEQSIQKRFKVLQSLRKSQGMASKYHSQSIQSSDFDKQNYDSMNEKGAFYHNSIHSVLARK